eukprot:TRINITY_DN1414_c0_g1_i8.p2 TRINITY_DN1414_c0_g1~~TRINITY_DN1414_c0_g1_i8.p2  ORF type:complete len:108 (+),score=11.63 TRINITY_DN1414_c0_g1_i8:222-545(+)
MTTISVRCLQRTQTFDDTILKREVKVKMSTSTNQLETTFQKTGLTHLFIYERPSSTPSFKSAMIHNLNIKGRKGNIVQTYLVVQYDFIPLDLNKSKRRLCPHSMDPQ